MILQNSEHQQSEIQHLLTFKKDSLNIYDFKNSIFFAMRIHVYGYIQKLINFYFTTSYRLLFNRRANSEKSTN